ncbi:MAG: metallophosphoesterase [Candidatus Pacearchaeota archaeon]
MTQKILKLFIEKGFLLDKEMLDFFNQLEDEELAKEIVNKLSVISHQKLITKTLINENIAKLKPVFVELEGTKKKIIEKFLVNVSVSLEVKKETSIEEEKIEANNEGVVKIISSPVIACQKLTVKDFVKNFRSRYSFFKNILKERKELEGLTSIDKISGNKQFSIIAMVNSKTTTKNNNIILEVEDLTGKAKLLINQNNPEISEKGKEILLDDVIGFKCSGTRDFVFVNDLFYPEATLGEKKKLDKEIYALFTSDIHIGSKNFIQNNFEKFINWFNDKNQKEFIDKIKYLFIVGDSIEGVGIYPGQEKELVIKDIKEQYVKLAEYLDKIPKHIQIIHCPGQHDAVRVAEPQPPVGEDFGEPLHKLKNLHLVSNPSLIEIEGSKNKEGFKVLMYHGASMHGVVDEIEELRLNKGHHTPTKIVKHLLKRRHLAPSHGSVVYIPNKEQDSLIITEIPDIVLTGDLHRPEIDMYNNILLIASSCWQSITPFEEKVGNKPDPCKVPILNLKTREIKILDFSE